LKKVLLVMVAEPLEKIPPPLGPVLFLTVLRSRFRVPVAATRIAPPATPELPLAMVRF
jgi:hypothetical protein